MFLQNLAFRNLRLNLRRSILIGILIAAGVAVAIVGNSFFESSRAGLKHTFVDCFTGDLFISPLTAQPSSLFGEDTPIIGSYSPIEELPRQAEIRKVAEGLPGVSSIVSQISGYALLETGGSRSPIVLFGVDGDSYFKTFGSVHLVKGEFLKTEVPGILMSEKKLKEIGKTNGKKPELGDPIQLSVFTNHGFSIREAPLVGAFEYPTASSVLDRIAYVDADTLRALNGMVRRQDAGRLTPPESGKYLDSDLNDIFDASASSGNAGPSLSLSDVEATLAKRDFKAPPSASDVSSWSFLILKLTPGADAKATRRELETRLRAQGLAARVGDWQAAAGSGAALAGSLSTGFNIGLGLLSLVIVLILANSFVTIVAERTSEIATMRAMGASRSFVRGMLLGEGMILAAISGAAGAGVAAVLVAVLHRKGIATGNGVLALIFGGDRLRPLLTPRVVIAAFVGAIVVSGIANLFGVRRALRIAPVRAMESE